MLTAAQVLTRCYDELAEGLRAVAASGGGGTVGEMLTAEQVLTRCYDEVAQALRVVQADGMVDLTPRTFAALPAAPVAGMLRVVTDTGSQGWADNVGGGGMFTVLAFYNGSSWTVVGV